MTSLQRSLPGCPACNSFHQFSIAQQVAPSLAATEHRGITIAQLETVMDEIDKHADADGYLPGWIDDYTGKTYHKNTINLCALDFYWKLR